MGEGIPPVPPTRGNPACGGAIFNSYELKNANLSFLKRRSKERFMSANADLSKKEHLALENLIKNRDLIIQKADKGNTAVILNKSD